MDTRALNNDNMAEKQPWQKPQIDVLQDQDTEGKVIFNVTEASPSVGPS